MSNGSFKYCWMLSLKVDVILLIGGFRVLIPTPSSLVDLPPITRSNNRFGFSLHYHQIIVIIIIFRQLYDVGIISIDFTWLLVILSSNYHYHVPSNCFYFDCNLTANTRVKAYILSSLCFGFPGWHTFWQWMWQRLDKVWYHHGLNKNFMIMITLTRIEGGSNYDNKRCATSSSTAPSVDRFDCCGDDHWFGIFWEMFRLTNFAPPIKEKSCTVFYGSSCWLRHHLGTVGAPSTATTTAWALPWLLRQWFSLFVVLLLCFFYFQVFSAFWTWGQPQPDRKSWNQ